jgi:iron complex transport system ATP-binding protein
LGLTVLLIIHDLNLASEYCDYLVLMKAGKVHTQGEPKEVLNYRNIEEVYQTVVVTQENPLSKKPAVFIVSNKLLKDHQKLE